MRQGNLQISPQGPIENQIVRNVAPRRSRPEEDEGDSLVLAVIRRRWKLLLLCALASIGAGFFAYSNFSLPEAKTESQLMYRALPPSVGQQINDPLQPLTIAEMIVSNENLLELAERHDLTMSARSLRKLFKIDASRFSNMIGIHLDWNNGQQAIDMVNDLMSIVSDRVMADRRQLLAQYRETQELGVAEVDAKIEDAKKEVNRLRKQMDVLLQQAGLDGPQNMILVRKIGDTELQLDNSLIERSTLATEISILRSEIDGDEQQMRAEALKGKIAQFEARKKIVRGGSSEMKSLETALNEFEIKNADLDFGAWRAKLDELGKSLLRQFPNESQASLQIMEVNNARKRQTLRSLELKQSPLNDRITQFHKRVDELKRQLAETSGNRQIASTALEDAEQDLQDLRDQRKDLLQQQSNFKRLEETDFRELKIQTPATWDTTELFDGKKKMFVLVFAGTFALLVFPVFTIEHFFPSGDRAERVSNELGLPVVGRGTFVNERLRHDKINYHPVNSESLRLLALRIQQSVQGPGGMVLFSGLDHECSAIPTITYLAECLARREERVLIIDACDRSNGNGKGNGNGKSRRKPKNSESMALASPKKIDAERQESVNGHKAKTNRDLVNQEKLPLGLSDFFERPDVSPTDLICSTDITGVDIIPSGNDRFPSEAFGSRRVSDLLDVCRQDYTMILVSGPSTSHPSDLQMLSARADGILFTVPNSRTSRNGDQVVRELTELGAPVIGIVG